MRIITGKHPCARCGHKAHDHQPAFSMYGPPERGGMGVCCTNNSKFNPNGGGKKVCGCDQFVPTRDSDD